MKELVNTSSDPADSYENDEIPEGWERKKLKEIFAWSNGKSLPKKNIDHGEFPVFGGNGINGYHSKYLIEKDCLVIGRVGADCGNVHLAPKKSWVTDNAIFTSGYPEATDLKFYYLLLKNLKLNSLSGGSGQPFLSQTVLDEICIAVPPISEQQHIVARVEALLTQVNAARERLNRVPLIMKKFRQAVLAAACSGRLTEGWRESNPSEETGFDLLQKIVEAQQKTRSKNVKKFGDANQIETEHLTEIPEVWTWATLDQITQNFDGHRIPIKSDDRQNRRGAYPYYGASGIIDTIDDFLFEGEFLLIGEDGANLVMRSTPIAFQAKGKFWVNNHAHILQTNGDIPLQFIEHYINSIDLQQYVTGSAQPKLTQTNMNMIPVPLPPLAEQHEIVRRVGMLFERADAIEREVAAAGLRCELLAQAVLARAFAGKL